jgi:hypothetical protein
VRVFDVRDPAQVALLCTLVAPLERSSAYRIEAAALDGRTYLFVADFGGGLFVYEATDFGALDPGTLVTEPFAHWQSPPCVTDALPNNVYGLAVGAAAEPATGELRVHLGVARVGVCTLRFRPEAAVAERLSGLSILQTPGDTAGLSLRPGATPGDATLLVADGHAGLRICELPAD